MTLNRHDAMFLRNVIHGAPISTLLLAVRLRQIDEDLNKDLPPERQFHKPYEYYADVAARLRRP